ncbi:hypothetical protein ABMA27_007068 [Loxostege sticticalis]|uniref:Uncharacterized protein n=1 Tax=Loxostege sticticalis TaxID=481309 RepID=A0ABR3ILF8_LOXSC
MNNLTNDFDETLSIDCHLLDNVESCVRYLGPEHSFTCLTFNIRSIQHNFDSFLVTLKRLNISLDVIVLTECWLSENSIIPQLPGYVSYRTHKYINKSGGVIAYIKDSTNACVNESACEECNCLEINLEGDTLVLGIDKCSPHLIKLIKKIIIKPLTHIYNLSLATGIFPEAWKTAIITPIHKSARIRKNIYVMKNLINSATKETLLLLSDVFLKLLLRQLTQPLPNVTLVTCYHIYTTEYAIN